MAGFLVGGRCVTSAAEAGKQFCAVMNQPNLTSDPLYRCVLPGVTSQSSAGAVIRWRYSCQSGAGACGQTTVDTFLQSCDLPDVVGQSAMTREEYSAVLFACLSVLFVAIAFRQVVGVLARP